MKIVLSFDMETDVGSWTGETRGMKEGTPEILRVLENHGVKSTFFFTGREALEHPGIVDAVLSDGHEIGCHTMYHETIGQAVFGMPGDLFVLDEEVAHRLEVATDAVEKAAGVRPISFRAPRLFGSTTMMNALEDLGYEADSSFPAYFHGRNFTPYRPSRGDWSKEGDMKILEIPVFYDTDEARGDRERDQWPMLRLRGGEWFAYLCKRMSARSDLLCVYLHPWEFVEMPRIIETSEASISLKPFLHQNCGSFTVKALDEFIGIVKDGGADFATAKEIAAAWPR